MPGAGNPLAWNRYAYTLYNPLKYTDPSGHISDTDSNHPVPDWEQERTLKQILEEDYGFSFIGEWMYHELKRIYRAVLAIQAYIDDLGKSGMDWIKNNLTASFAHGNLFGNHFVTGNTIHIIPGSDFDKETVVHEFGHVLDNNIGYGRQSGMTTVTIGGGIEAEIPFYYDATIYGGGPADDLFIAMGGNPTGLRFMNGDLSYPYSYDVGVMKTLPKVARFPDRHYGNHCSADYFAETWAGAVLGKLGPPPGALNWMNQFVSGMN